MIEFTLKMGYSGGREMKQVARRILALGVLFLLSPIWTFPLINPLAVSIVEAKDKNPASSWIAFARYDSDTQVLQFRTDKFLYLTGVFVTGFAGSLLILSKFDKRRSTLI
jgi:hypothetical protein